MQQKDQGPRIPPLHEVCRGAAAKDRKTVNELLDIVLNSHKVPRSVFEQEARV